MKVYLLYTHYYNYCEQFDTLHSIYTNEDLAVLAQIALEDSDKRHTQNKDQYWTSIKEEQVVE